MHVIETINCSRTEVTCFPHELVKMIITLHIVFVNLLCLQYIALFSVKYRKYQVKKYHSFLFVPLLIFMNRRIAHNLLNFVN
jgi:hypothetical protein